MAKKSKKAADVEELDDDLELELDEELDEEAEKPAPKKGKGKAKAEKPEIWGTRQLADYIAEEIGETYTTKQLRTQLRRMARDGRIEREVIAGNKAPYEWEGPEDPEVVAILAAVKEGEIEEATKEALDKLRKDKESKGGKGKAKGKGKGKGKKAKPAPEPEDDDDELELDDDED